MDFKNINISFVNNELDTHISNNRSLIVSLKNLQDNKYSNRELWQFKYLSLLIDKLDYVDRESNILTCKFDVLLDYKQEFQAIKELQKQDCLTKKKKGCNCFICSENAKNIEFSKKIQSILKYQHDKLRGYYSNSGIKTCYVCNAQYAVMAKDEKKGRNINSKIINQERDKAKFELDHILPKSIFPCFSISLYNLLPICPPCNKIKTNNEIDVSNILTKVKYKITIKSLQQYYKGEGQLEIEVLDETNENANKQLSRVFDLKGIYRNHIDVIEELIERKIKYTDNYRAALSRSFPGIVGTEKNIDERLIIGTYSKEEGFLKRPLSKFIHDINDQLDSITGYFDRFQ